jgi:hypothetical protein
MRGGRRESWAIADGSSKENGKRHMHRQEIDCRSDRVRCSAGTQAEITVPGAERAEEVFEMR